MASTYVHKLELLMSWYGRDVLKNDLPNDVSNECAMWLMEEPQIAAKKYEYDYCALPLEIQLKGFVTSIIDYKDIGKYEILYMDNKDNIDYNQQEMKEDEKKRLQYCHTKFIYNYNCLAFTGLDDVKFKTRGNKVIQIIAWDKNDHIIARSEWKKFDIPVRWADISWDPNAGAQSLVGIDHDDICKFFNEGIDTENQGFVNVDQWTLTMQQHYGYNEDVAHRLYHFVCFMNNKQDEMTATDFTKSVCRQDVTLLLEEYENMEGFINVVIVWLEL